MLIILNKKYFSTQNKKNFNQNTFKKKKNAPKHSPINKTILSIFRNPEMRHKIKDYYNVRSKVTFAAPAAFNQKRPRGPNIPLYRRVHGRDGLPFFRQFAPKQRYMLEETVKKLTIKIPRAIFRLAVEDYREFAKIFLPSLAIKHEAAIESKLRFLARKKPVRRAPTAKELAAARRKKRKIIAVKTLKVQLRRSNRAKRRLSASQLKARLLSSYKRAWIAESKVLKLYCIALDRYGNIRSKFRRHFTNRFNSYDATGLNTKLLLRRLFFTRRVAPVASRRHGRWLLRRSEKTWKDDPLLVTFRIISRNLKKRSKFFPHPLYLAKKLFFSKHLFWAGAHFRNDLRLKKDATYRKRFFPVRTKNLMRNHARWINKKFSRAMHFAQINIFKSRSIPKRSVPFIRNRNSSQAVEAARRDFQGLFPWSVNYRRTGVVERVENIWDHQNFCNRNATFSYFLDDSNHYRTFSNVINLLPARAANLRIFGKLLNSHFSKTQVNFDRAAFVENSAVHRISNSSVLYNQSDTSAGLFLSKKISGFVPDLLNSLINELSYPSSRLIASGATLGWDKHTNFLAPGDVDVERKIVSFDKASNDAFYETDFNKFWNINFHKFNIYGLSRNNFRMFGSHLTGSNFLLNFESALEDNFSNFYSSNKFAFIKLVNSLFSNAIISDLLPKGKHTTSAAINSFKKTQLSIRKLNKRARWLDPDDCESRIFKNSSYFIKSTKCTHPFYQATLRRIQKLSNLRMSRLFRELPYDQIVPFYVRKFIYNIWKGRYRPDAVALPMLIHLSKLITRLSLLQISKATSIFKYSTNPRLWKQLWGKKASAARTKRLTAHQISSLFDPFIESQEAFFEPLIKKVMSAEITSSELKAALKEIAVRAIKRRPAPVVRKRLKKLSPFELQQLKLSALSINDPQMQAILDEVWSTLHMVLAMRKKSSFLTSYGGVKEVFLDSVTRAVKALNPLDNAIQHKIKQYKSTLGEIKYLVAAKRAAWAKRPDQPFRPRFLFPPRRNKPKLKPFSILAKGRNIVRRYRRLSPAQLIYLKTAGINISSAAALSKKQFSKFWPRFSSYAEREKSRAASGPFDNDDSSFDIESSEWSDIVEDEARGKGDNIGAAELVTTIRLDKKSRKIKKNKKDLKEQRMPLFLLFPKTLGDVICGDIEDFWQQHDVDVKPSGFSLRDRYLRPGLLNLYRKSGKKNYGSHYGPVTAFYNNKCFARGSASYWARRIYENKKRSIYLRRKLFYNLKLSKLNYTLLDDFALLFFSFFHDNGLLEEFDFGKNDEIDMLAFAGKPAINKVHNLPGATSANLSLLKRVESKAIGFNFIRFSLADHLTQTFKELTKHKKTFFSQLQNTRKTLLNLVRFNKETTLVKKNPEAKGRSLFVYYTQKKPWILRKHNKPFRAMMWVSTPIPYTYAERIHASTSVYGFRKFNAARRRARAKHYKQKVYIKKILRRRFSCNMSALRTRWRLAKETKRKWYKYFDEFEGKLANILCLMGYYEDLESASEAIVGRVVSVNNSVCINPAYRVKPLDVISINMQAYADLRAEYLSDIFESHLADSDSNKDVKRRILEEAADFLKAHSAVARLRGEGYSVTKFLFFKKLLSSVVVKLKDRKKSLKKSARKSFGKKKKKIMRAPRAKRLNYYTLGDLGAGVSYEKFSAKPLLASKNTHATSSRLKRKVAAFLNEEALGLSSSLSSASNIYYKFNNVAIYLRRPNTINEMFDTTAIPCTGTYNAEVIEEFYTTRFWK